MPREGFRHGQDRKDPHDTNRKRSSPQTSAPRQLPLGLAPPRTTHTHIMGWSELHAQKGEATGRDQRWQCVLVPGGRWVAPGAADRTLP